MSNELITQHKDLPEELQGLDESLLEKIFEASKILEDSATVSVTKIRNDAKCYILPDGTEVSELKGIIVGVKHANVHYPADYQEGVITPPDCVAITEGKNDFKCIDLKPHNIVASKYSINCRDCKKFEWGSATRGSGKACTEHVLLAVYFPQLGDGLYLMEEKKSNAKVCDNYIATVRQRYVHPVMVLTRFEIGKSNKWEQKFFAETRTTTELANNLAGRLEEANSMLVSRILSSYKDESTYTNESETTVTEGKDKPKRQSRG